MPIIVAIILAVMGIVGYYVGSAFPLWDRFEQLPVFVKLILAGYMIMLSSTPFLILIQIEKIVNNTAQMLKLLEEIERKVTDPKNLGEYEVDP